MINQQQTIREYIRFNAVYLVMSYLLLGGSVCLSLLLPFNVIGLCAVFAMLMAVLVSLQEDIKRLSLSGVVHFVVGLVGITYDWHWGLGLFGFHLEHYAYVLLLLGSFFVLLSGRKR